MCEMKVCSASLHNQLKPQNLSFCGYGSYEVNAGFYTAHVRQFDTMVYPEQKKVDMLGWYSRSFELWTGRMHHSRFDVPSPCEMRVRCIKMYLEECDTVLLHGKFESKFDMLKAVKTIMDIYQCCTHQYCGTSESNVTDQEFSYPLSKVSTCN